MPPPPAAALALPCSRPLGWQLVRQLELPRRGPAAEPIGGFSAAWVEPPGDRLLLLSDLPRASFTLWSGLLAAARGNGDLRLVQVVPLRSGAQHPLPAALDGEALAPLMDQFWLVSEGRRSLERPPQLLRIAASSGELLEPIALPLDWQAAPGRGLASNGGPESLSRLPGAGPPELLMGAEQALLQDSPRAVRLLRWSWRAGQDPRRTAPEPRPQGALLLPAGEGWGLTELLALGPDRLLALLRRFQPPDRWQIRLALYPLPPAAAAGRPAAPLAGWDLIALGLSPDNWEAMAPGPRLADGRPSLLLASDDNLSPFQANRLALLTATGCGSPSTSAAGG